MPAISNEIPLFPAPTVLFPGTFMTLQITDEAQRTLLRACVDGTHRLGVVLAGACGGGSRDAVPCTTGCLASIALFTEEDSHQLPSGVILYGEQRIRILDFVRNGTILTGNVELLEESHGINAERKMKRTMELFQQYLSLLRQRHQTDIIDVPIPENPTMASYMLASILYLPPEIKQRWLESASATTRLEEQLAFLYNECEQLSLFLKLAQNTSYRFITPDYQSYTALVSPN